MMSACLYYYSNTLTKVDVDLKNKKSTTLSFGSLENFGTEGKF